MQTTAKSTQQITVFDALTKASILLVDVARLSTSKQAQSMVLQAQNIIGGVQTALLHYASANDSPALFLVDSKLAEATTSVTLSSSSGTPEPTQPASKKRKNTTTQAKRDFMQRSHSTSDVKPKTQAVSLTGSGPEPAPKSEVAVEEKKEVEPIDGRKVRRCKLLFSYIF